MEVKARKGPPWWKSCRYLLAFLAGFGYSIHFLQRVNFSMAVVCMVNNTALDLMSKAEEDLILSTPYNETDSRTFTYNTTYRKNDKEETCGSRALNTSDQEDGELLWSKETQSILLGGYYWGYVMLQIPSQRIVQRAGCKNTALVAVFVFSVMSCLGPVLANISPWLFMASRVIEGLSSAFGVPALYAMWGPWAPPQERTMLISICFSGNFLANAVVFYSSGLLCKYGFAGGWPSVFYVFGICGFVWCGLWVFLVYETPDQHPRIDPAEREYIRTSMGSEKKHMGSIPWKKILTSVPVYSLIFAQLAYNWGLFLFLAVLPTYMKEVLHFDIQSNGLYTMMPQIAIFIFTNLWGVIGGRLIYSKKLSVKNVRRLSAFIGDVIPAGLFITISYLGCDRAMTVVVLMTLAIGISGVNLQGFLVNPYDIAPRFATAILSLSNTVAVASGIVSPYVVAALTPNKTREEWQVVFFLTAGFAVFGCLQYAFFIQAKEQDWAKAPETENETKQAFIPDEKNSIMIIDRVKDKDGEVLVLSPKDNLVIADAKDKLVENGLKNYI